MRSWSAHCRPVTSLSWSQNGRKLLSSSLDGTVKLWDVLTEKEENSANFHAQILGSEIHPSGNLCVVCPNGDFPLLLDFESGERKYLPGRPAGHNENVVREDKGSKKSRLESLGAATFNKEGDTILYGTSSGEVFAVNVNSRKLIFRENLCKGVWAVKQLVLSNDDKLLLVNCSDRVLRQYKISANLEFDREFKDIISKKQWKACGFSNLSDYVFGGPYEISEHRIHVWDALTGRLEMLEGPKETIVDVVWHPTLPVIASCSDEGVVYFWSCDFSESWSAYAPNFTELQENVEYVEMEDEFDVPDDNKQDKKVEISDEPVDIGDNDFPSQEDELLYIPIAPETEKFDF